MMSNLHRPCRHEAFNDGEPFDAVGAVVSIVEGGISKGIQQVAVKLDLANGYSEEFDFETRDEAYKMYQSVLLDIAEALNAPVKVTQEWVQSACEKSRLFLFSDNLTHWFQHEFDCFKRTDVLLGEEYFVKATCPETLEYLLQFTLDGKRKETK